MLMAYIDDSGDPGADPKSSSMTFVLGCVLVDSNSWNPALDDLIRLRKNLNHKFNLPIRAEVKADYLLRSKGDLESLNYPSWVRRLIYRAHLKQLQQSGLFQVFSVVIHKSGHSTSDEIFEAAWVALFQRLQRTSEALGNVPVIIMHDEGHANEVRTLARKSRRWMTAGAAFGSASFKVSFTNLVEDPVSKHSKDSYFIQAADLVAYASFRRIIPPPPKRAEVVDSKTWDHLGSAILTAVTSVKHQTTPGIVERTI